jgi:hypothetical protein
VLSPVNIHSEFTWIPYGSDHFVMTWPTWTGDLPDYPDWRAYDDPAAPWTPGSINDCVIAGDEMNGGGVNWPREVWGWDDIVLSRPTVLAGAGNTDPTLPHESGQTVDTWIGRENRTYKLPRDHNKTKAAGRAGHIDERHPR